MSTRRWVVLVALSLAASACGSTVQVGGPAQSGGTGAAVAQAPAGGGAGFGVPGGAPVAGATGPTSAAPRPVTGQAPVAQPAAAVNPAAAGARPPAPAATAPGGGAPSAPAPAAPAPGGGGPAPGTPPGAPAPPAPADLPPIQIGTYYLEGGNEAVAALGAGGLVIPDNRPVFDAFVQYANERGGFAGRQIEPVYFAYQSGQDPHVQDAAACATYTEDHDVYLVIGGINSGAGELLPCLADHDVPLIGAATQGDRRYFEQYTRYAYEPGGLNLTSGLELLVAELHQRGFLDDVDSVGLLQYPGTVYDQAVDDGLVPALARVGLSLTDRVTTTSSTDVGQISVSSSNAVLRFNSQGIDLVVFVAPGGAAQLFFMTNAQNQGYKPKYGIWSADSPYIMATTAPAAQLSGSIGVGYLPGLDVAAEQDPTASTPAGQACLELGRSMGLDDSGLGNALIRVSCDVFFTLHRATGSDPATTTSTAVFEQAIDAIGAGYEPAGTFAMGWSPGRHDAAAGYRSLVYDTGCSCFTYTGETLAIP